MIDRIGSLSSGENVMLRLLGNTAHSYSAAKKYSLLETEGSGEDKKLVIYNLAEDIKIEIYRKYNEWVHGAGYRVELVGVLPTV